MSLTKKIDPRALNVCKTLKEAGGLPYIVGGAVRDMVQGVEPKDYDIEVFMLDASDTGYALWPYGAEKVGVSFGVFTMSVNGLEVQVSLPRRESKEGRGHKGFIATFDPMMTMKEACSRRDFTMNSMALNPFSGELVDPFDGYGDIERRRLSHTSNAFAEDPLRVLRGMQLAGRYNLFVCSGTAIMCSELIGEYGTLSAERIFGEWWKWACKSTVPSAGLHFLLDTKWLLLYMDLLRMRYVKQDPSWHPEGSVWTHTLYCVNRAADIATRENLSPEDRGILVMAALLHDIGKADTTVEEDGRIKSPGHDEVGVIKAEDFLKSIGFPFDKDGPTGITRKIINLVGAHMQHDNKPSRKSVLRLAKKIAPASIYLLTLLMEADNSARPPLPKGMPLNAYLMKEIADNIGVIETPKKPILMGRNLLDFGVKPGKGMGDILRLAEEAQLNEEFSDIEGAIKWAKAKFSLIDPDPDMITGMEPWDT